MITSGLMVWFCCWWRLSALPFSTLSLINVYREKSNWRVLFTVIKLRLFLRSIFPQNGFDRAINDGYIVVVLHMKVRQGLVTLKGILRGSNNV